MDPDPNDTEPLDPTSARSSAQHPAGHEDEVLLDSSEQAAALLAEVEGDDDGESAPWADGPDRGAGGDLPEPLPSSAQDAEDARDEVLPMSVEGVGDLVADPLSRTKVIPRDDPGGPADDEVPPSPS